MLGRCYSDLPSYQHYTSVIHVNNDTKQRVNSKSSQWRYKPRQSQVNVIVVTSQHCQLIHEPYQYATITV